MDEGKRNELEAKLKKMLEMSSKTQMPAEKSEPKRVCNVIRRRKGEQDKRIFVLK